jgi:hypothetical protein
MRTVEEQQAFKVSLRRGAIAGDDGIAPAGQRRPGKRRVA